MVARSLVLATALLLACALAASTFLDFVGVQVPGSRRHLQLLGVSIGELLWTLIRGGCFLRGFFLEPMRYIDMARREDYTTIEMKGEEVIDGMRINNVGPSSLHGFFWLNIQGLFTEVASFAPTEEGGGLSLGTWTVGVDGKPFYRIRILGDGTWGGTGYPPFLVRITDPVATFTIEEGTADNPVTFRITLEFVFPFTCTRFSTEGCLVPVLDWTMTLVYSPTSVDDGRPTHETYDDSYVWLRDSAGILDFQYEAIQVADGDGNSLSAMSDFIESVNEESLGGALVTSVLNPDASVRFCSKSWWCFWC